MALEPPAKKVLLVVVDGWGLGPEDDADAFHAARAPRLKGFLRDAPCSRLLASGEAVGLPPGFMGNSEVGHLTLGAGRVVWQSLARIDRAVADGSLASNPALVGAVRAARDAGGSVHFLGLLSDGGVHSHDAHLHALLRIAAREGLPRARVLVHAFLDGRDTPPRSALPFLARVQANPEGRLASVTGRYYAMDRDARWDRTERAYRMLVEGKGGRGDDARAVLDAQYAAGITDEFVPPTRLLPEGEGLVGPRDAVVFFNFRPDRARQLTRALFEPAFDGFARGPPPGWRGVTMTQYDASFPLDVAFPPEFVRDTLGEVLAARGLRQLRVAETEKYAHVTYFFNGGDERALPGEERVLVPSQKVATYDPVPAMSAPGITEKVLGGIDAGAPFVLVNYANMDMVGHTGVFRAAVEACEAVDACVGGIADRALAQGYAVLVTADHGNVEVMRGRATGQPHTAHTTNRVPCLLLGVPAARVRPEGGLADVAPTVLDVMGIPKPGAMTGTSLLVTS